VLNVAAQHERVFECVPPRTWTYVSAALQALRPYEWQDRTLVWDLLLGYLPLAWASALLEVADARREPDPESRATSGQGPEPTEASSGGGGGRAQEEHALELGIAALRRRLDWSDALTTIVQPTPMRAPSLARPNRRFPERVGEIPGRGRARVAHAKPELLVAIDTSGSMEERVLSEIAAHLVDLGRHARLFVAECDSEIRRIYRFAGKLRVVHGRGGTDFRPVFAPEILRSYGRDGVVYFTDGRGRWPDGEPPVSVLWALTGSEPFECPWGARVWLGAA
jgi:hypothetical protein